MKKITKIQKQKYHGQITGGYNLTTINNYQIENEEENENWDQFIQQSTEENEKYFNTNFTYNEKKVQDAMFEEAIVFGERINVIFDTGSKGCAISKQFLDRKKQSIDGSSSIKLIDIQGNRVTPLGEKNNIQINIEGIDLSADMVVTESKDYNIILGNDWLSKVKAKIDYNGQLTISTEQGEIITPVTCWEQIRNPLQFFSILQRPNENNQFELELEDEDDATNDDGQTFFLNIQESQKAIKIRENLYPKECIEYWNQQMQNKDNKI